jgi:hypothetical protein
VLSEKQGTTVANPSQPVQPDPNFPNLIPTHLKPIPSVGNDIMGYNVYTQGSTMVPAPIAPTATRWEAKCWTVERREARKWKTDIV